jgi:teichuronic acid biosynthesis glycosyltransferase TuaG
MDQDIAVQKVTNTEALVSILMPAYNAEKFIEESIRSVIAQTYKNWELIVIDDGSTDDTGQIVEKIRLEDNRVRYLYQTNQRQAAARNNGFKVSQGSWIAFLDADDLWSPKKLEIQLGTASDYQVQVLYSTGYYLTQSPEESESYNTKVGLYSGEEMYKELLHNNIIPILSVILHRDVVIEVGSQDISANVHGCEDYDYWLRIAKLNYSFYGVPEHLFHYRVHNEGTSANKQNMLKVICRVLCNNLNVSLLSVKEAHAIKVHLHSIIRYVIATSISERDYKTVAEFIDLGTNHINELRFKLAGVILKTLKSGAGVLIKRVI